MRVALRSLAVMAVLAVFLMNQSQAQVREIQFEDLQSYFHKSNDTLYVINFWATWCKPCVKELPYFERIHDNFSNRKVAVLLVSLDFSSNLNAKVRPFVKERNFKSQVMFLHQPRGHEWMNKVSDKWSGAIPATYFIKNNGSQSAFYEKAFDNYRELYNIIQQMI